MRSLLKRILYPLLFCAVVLTPMGAVAQIQPPSPCDFVNISTGTFTNAGYEIITPKFVPWNGVLLVYAHGYTPDVEPAFDQRIEPMACQLAATGYAVAGSSYRNGGWAVKEGLQNTLALTNRFNGLVGQPTHTYLWGTSMGSLIALKAVEKYLDIYDGAIAACGVGGGAPLAMDAALALALAYDVAFATSPTQGGWLPAWGTVGNVRDGIDFESEVAPVLVPQLLAALMGPLGNPLFARFEFIRLVMDLPAEDFYPPFTGDPANPIDPMHPGGFLVDMQYATEVRDDVERRANGPVSQNLDHLYRLTPAAMAYLSTVGLAETDQLMLLAAMNDPSRDLTARRSAREYVERYASFTGYLEKPVLTIHTEIDPIAPPFNEYMYRQTVLAAGSGDQLLQLFTSAPPGHCEFTPGQMLAAIQGLEFRVANGVWPPPAFFQAYDPNFDFTYTPSPPAFLDPMTLSAAQAGDTEGRLFLPFAIR